MMELSLEQIKAKLHYSPLAGVFERRSGNRRKGYRWVLTGSIRDSTGYLVVSVGGKSLLAHRLAWFFVHGEWPEGDIDHKDGDKLNNAISNLRLATSAQNSHNSQTPKHNQSGIKGVSYCKAEQKWTAQVAVGRKPVLMKRFKTKEEAAHAVQLARIEAHGEFANHGTHRYIEEEACNFLID